MKGGVTHYAISGPPIKLATGKLASVQMLGYRGMLVGKCTHKPPLHFLVVADDLMSRSVWIRLTPQPLPYGQAFESLFMVWCTCATQVHVQISGGGC
jgi:hypothetical protein